VGESGGAIVRSALGNTTNFTDKSERETALGRGFQAENGLKFSAPWYIRENCFRTRPARVAEGPKTFT